jgi:hypothetical protein
MSAPRPLPTPPELMSAEDIQVEILLILRKFDDLIEQMSQLPMAKLAGLGNGGMLAAISGGKKSK